MAIADALLICCLRHPVDRAYSDYLMHLRSHGLGLDPARDLKAQARWAQPDSRQTSRVASSFWRRSWLVSLMWARRFTDFTDVAC